MVTFHPTNQLGLRSHIAAVTLKGQSGLRIQSPKWNKFPCFNTKTGTSSIFSVPNQGWIRETKTNQILVRIYDILRHTPQEYFPALSEGKGYHPRFFLGLKIFIPVCIRGFASILE